LIKSLAEPLDKVADERCRSTRARRGAGRAARWRATGTTCTISARRSS